MRRRGHGVRVAAAISFAAGLLVPAAVRSPVFAGEPSGCVLLQAAWVDEAAADPHRRLLRLTVRPLVPLEQWKLSVSAPLTFDIRERGPSSVVDFRGVPAEDNRRTIRAEMRALGVSETLTLEFEIIFPPRGGGTLSFSVESEGRDGRPSVEAVGITARAAGPAPVRRLGAVEFRAAVVPPERAR